MKMQELQVLINGQIQPEQICIQQLVALAKQHTLVSKTEYKLIEDAVNIVLIHYLKQAQAYL
ncbi:hypothetical protein [Acinetobacter beijerinckii]|nr:hypothetical protein [Acinetobacter beijerinckii]